MQRDRRPNDGSHGNYFLHVRHVSESFSVEVGRFPPEVAEMIEKSFHRVIAKQAHPTIDKRIALPMKNRTAPIARSWVLRAHDMTSGQHKHNVELEPTDDCFIGKVKGVTGLVVVTLQEVNHEAYLDVNANYSAHFGKGPQHLVDHMALLQGDGYARDLDLLMSNLQRQLCCDIDSHEIRATVIPGIYRHWGVSIDWDSASNRQRGYKDHMFFGAHPNHICRKRLEVMRSLFNMGENQRDCLFDKHPCFWETNVPFKDILLGLHGAPRTSIRNMSTRDASSSWIFWTSATSQELLPRRNRGLQLQWRSSSKMTSWS